MCLSCTVTDMFSDKYRRDLQISVTGYSRSLKIRKLWYGSVFALHGMMATVAVSLAVSTQYANVTGTQPPQDSKKAALMHRIARQKSISINTYHFRYLFMHAVHFPELRLTIRPPSPIKVV